ncbi:hypothetical protein FALB51S_02518 [Frigidibacter albus]|uniref:Uncharacterized protein n=1 Tax=Frigidibacter mobilis TaxID=1335048 RepID=A0A159Z1M7_9RHOB|nr:hypothetical protein AKL17_1589 [Frigidibacter mobilis]
MSISFSGLRLGKVIQGFPQPVDLSGCLPEKARTKPVK